MKQRYYILMAVSVICLIIGGGTLLTSAIFQDFTGYWLKLTASRFYLYLLWGSWVVVSLKQQGKIREVARWIMKIQLYVLAAVFAGITCLVFIRPETIQGEWWEIMIFQGLILPAPAVFYWLGKKA